ncbi:MAG: hypothetical protein E7182_00145 [Erysipelotrichaceae bacterium]|nr:hypothetical protein [Erysipelotrichaceae bacterium]
MKAKGFLKKVFSSFFSKKGVISLGVISLVYILAITTLFAVTGVSYSNPAAISGKDFQSLRKQVIDQGQAEDPFLIDYDFYGKSFVGTERTLDEETYYVYVSNENLCSNYLGIATKVLYEDYGLVLGLTLSHFLERAYQNDHDFVFVAQTLVIHNDGSPYVFYDYFLVNAGTKYDCSIQGELKLNHDYYDDWGIDLDPQIIAEINQNSEGLLRDFFPKAKAVIDGFGVHSDSVFKGIKRSFEASEAGSGLLSIAAVLSFFGGPITMLFILGLARLLIQKKKRRLLQEGALTEREGEDLLVTLPGIETSTLPPPEERKGAAVILEGPIERFCAKTHIRPVLGEWVIRGVGFALIVLGSIFMHIIDASLATPAVEDLYPLFKMINAAGQVLLVVALIGIIAETRRNLTFTAAAFFTMAVTFYLAVNSVFFALDSTIRTDFMGITISQFLSKMLPGNIFMSMGLFAFIGFFLFEDPPSWLVKRKVFRLLSLIPTGIAILSVVLSILYRAEAIPPNYWVSSFFFVRDVDGMFVGIAFLFELFLFRHFLAKRYGKENVDEVMSRPSVQFKKNLILCLIIAIYTAIFYLVPSGGRTYLRLDDHTLIFCLIPLLLFYKPAGKNRSNVSNILYYALYILTFLIPTIVTLAME